MTDLDAADPAELPDETWTRSPRSYVMPDRFVVMTFNGGLRATRWSARRSPTR